MTEIKRQKDFTHSGFFALRTPLLPFDEFSAWGEGLKASTALDDPTRLEETFKSDCAHLRARLYQIVIRPEVQDALFVASPDFEEVFNLWVTAPESERGQRLEGALVRYFARMAGRATPFGLFAGCSVGLIGNETKLVIEGRANYQRHTRLDSDYLYALIDTLTREPAVRNRLVYRPNSSLYRAAGRVRYLEARLNGTRRSHHLVTVENTEYLDATLARAKAGARLAALAAALVDDDVSFAEAEKYITELIESQILVPDLSLSVTGPEPINTLLTQLRGDQETKELAHRLNSVHTELAAIDAAGLGVETKRYRIIADHLKGLPAKINLQKLFQVDMIKPTSGATLGGRVLSEIVRGVEILQRLAKRPAQDALTRFKETFRAHYEEREVPLTEALDEEAGVGFTSSGKSGVDASPLLAGLVFPATSEKTAVWGEREIFLLQKLTEAFTQGAHEMILEPQDLEKIATKNPPSLPTSFAVTATIAAPSQTALNQGDFRVLLGGVVGPSGARLLGRFCHADETLQQHVQKHLSAEEALEPEAIFAEIVHLPEERVGNVICRPVLRNYEIPYLGRSGAPVEQQIPVTDLFVSLVGDQIILRSARLGRRVIPRLTNAHNFTLRTVGVYQFLALLQNQNDAAEIGWDWGPLWNAPFLPRVTIGRFVLSRACWRVSKEELQHLGKHHGAAQFRAVQLWRMERHLPRLVALADGDNILPIDLNNALSVESFVNTSKGRGGARLLEMFPGPDQLCVQGPDGKFVHELVVPFVRISENKKLGVDVKEKGKTLAGSPQPSISVQRTFPPGSEWLYAKLYTGTATADHMLRDEIGPIIKELLGSGATDRWFFIRYGDPEWHLRLRFHGSPEKLHAEVLPVLETATAPLLEDRRLWRVQYDTYEREIERYGGAKGIVLAEQIFHADSEAVLEIIEMLEPGDAGADERWRMAVRGTDMLLNDFGFDLSIKRLLLKQLRDAFAKEFYVDENFKSQLSDKYRKERKSLETLLNPTHDEESPLLPGFIVLQNRSQKLAPIVAELKTYEQAGLLSVPLAELASSYIHMYVNRLLRSAHRAQELVIYDFLARLYEAQAARIK